MVFFDTDESLLRRTDQAARANFLQIRFFFKIYIYIYLHGPNMMIQTVESLHHPKNGYGTKFEPLVLHKSQDICENL